MSIFNRFFKSGEKSSVPSQDSQNWDSLQEVKFNDPNQNTTAEESTEILTPNLRQQNKLIQVILNNDIDIINQSSTDVTPAERKNFLKSIANGTITSEDFDNVVSQIRAPYMDKSLDAIVNNSIASDKHLSRILAATTDLGFDDYNSVNDNTLAEFIQRYPNPQNFEEVSNHFLQDIRLNNPFAKYEEYTKSMQDFKHIIYGKRQEYFDQAKILQKEASSQHPQTSSEPTPKSPETLRPIESLIDSATFDNDAFIQNGQEHHLTTEHLRQANLTPHHELNIEGYRIGFSDAFQIQDRDACLGYVETTDGKVVVRPYYRSNSAGVWRFMPGYTPDENGNIDWFDKGYTEDSLTLPFEFQQKLNQITKKEPANLNGISPDFIFAGAARRYPSMYDRLNDIAEGTIKGDYYQEVQRSANLDFNKLPGTDIKSMFNEKLIPESIDLRGDMSPNFSQNLDSTSANTSENGEVIFKLFPSYNNSLHYLFAETQKNNKSEVWLCNVEIPNSKLTSTGCRADYINTGDAGTPLHEYRDQADKDYREEMDIHTEYVDMWPKYLSKIPFIQRYLNQTRK